MTCNIDTLKGSPSIARYVCRISSHGVLSTSRSFVGRRVASLSFSAILGEPCRSFANGDQDQVRGCRRMFFADPHNSPKSTHLFSDWSGWVKATTTSHVKRRLYSRVKVERTRRSCQNFANFDHLSQPLPSDSAGRHGSFRGELCGCCVFDKPSWERTRRGDSVARFNTGIDNIDW